MLVAMLIPASVFAQPPRRDNGQRFTPPKHAPQKSFAPQVHVPQRSYDRQYRDYHYRSNYGNLHYRPYPVYPPVYPARPGVVVVPTVGYYNGYYGDWGAPYVYGTNGFSVTVGGHNGSISVTGIR